MKTQTVHEKYSISNHTYEKYSISNRTYEKYSIITIFSLMRLEPSRVENPSRLVFTNPAKSTLNSWVELHLQRSIFWWAVLDKLGLYSNSSLSTLRTNHRAVENSPFPSKATKSKELSSCNKLWFSNPYIFEIRRSLYLWKPTLYTYTFSNYETKRRALQLLQYKTITTKVCRFNKRLSRFDAYWILTNKQTDRQAKYTYIYIYIDNLNSM